MKDLLRTFWYDDSGQGLSEYALILALISVGLILVLFLFRNAIGSVFDKIGVALHTRPEVIQAGET